ncbi:MAG: histidine phosphatase family protein, partial [Arthrobacter sp.]
MNDHHLKKLMIMRHAKAAWPLGVEDHERPLAKRG